MHWENCANCRGESGWFTTGFLWKTLFGNKLKLLQSLISVFNRRVEGVEGSGKRIIGCSCRKEEILKIRD